MTRSLAPHLNFDGNARDALSFYGTVLGAEPVIRTYGEFGMPAGLPDTDKVVWGQVATRDGVRIMAYDVPTQQTDRAATQHGATRRENGLTVTDQPYFLALSSATLDDAAALWNTLTVGATVLEPLAASAWSAGFGMLTDSFGVTWVIDVQSADDYS
ncbi:VOC family protein [Microbacterium sulfonylureivorans]|uniref:VOC family protein n=1 Tax=Microbacterium sulfonylureivorans TaxID=2486854 RepID=UPI000FD8DF0C|nr:VOC family protein [Microbacterium sulfonylureivorans]